VRLGATVKIDVSDNEPSAGPQRLVTAGVDGIGFEGADGEDAFVDAPERSASGGAAGALADRIVLARHMHRLIRTQRFGAPLPERSGSGNSRRRVPSAETG
jgi:hypothetical protein